MSSAPSGAHSLDFGFFFDIQFIFHIMTEADTRDGASKPAALHFEGSAIATDAGKIRNGDAALALFDNLEEMHETFEPGEEKRLVRKIDWMILPFLSVCDAFYYVRPRPVPSGNHGLKGRSIKLLFPTPLFSALKKI